MMCQHGTRVPHVGEGITYTAARTMLNRVTTPEGSFDDSRSNLFASMTVSPCAPLSDAAALFHLDSRATTGRALHITRAIALASIA